MSGWRTDKLLAAKIYIAMTCVDVTSQTMERSVLDEFT